MIKETVSSSMINCIGYNQEDALLEVEFSNGTVYQYKDVPLDIFSNLMSANSIGKYLNENIKDVYSFEKIK